jgi:hypothetical protein
MEGRAAAAQPADGSPDWAEWEPSHEGGWLCDNCLVEEIKDHADEAELMGYEVEMDGWWGTDS